MLFSFCGWNKYTHQSWVKTIIQPGGSIRDQEIINAAIKQISKCFLQVLGISITN